MSTPPPDDQHWTPPGPYDAPYGVPLPSIVPPPVTEPPVPLRADGQPGAGLDSPLGRVMSRMLLCACQALTDAGRPVCDCCWAHTASVPTMDVFCNCDCIDDPAYAKGGGQAWVRLVRMDPLSRDLDMARCSPMQVQAIVEVGVFRCWPSSADGKTAPDCATERLPAAMGLVTDGQLLWMSQYCCNENNPADWINDWDIQPNILQPISPQGGCAGVAVMSYVRGVLPGTPDLVLMARNGP